MPNIYNTIYLGNFCSEDGTDNVIAIKRRMSDALPIPVPIPIIFAGHNNEPVTFEFTDKGDYKQEPVNGLDMTINIKAINGFELSSLYTADEREWLVDVSGLFNMQGFIIPDSCTEPYESQPYDVTIQITDCLGTLEDIPFAKADGVVYKGFISDIELIQICLAKTGLSIPLLTGINTYEVTMNRSVGPLQQTFRDTARYLDTDGNPFSCLEVLRSIIEHWSARLHQFNGYWQIVNVLEKSKGNVKAWKYTTAGVADGFITIGNTIIAGGQDRELQPSGASNSTAKALKLSTAYYQYGYPANALLNGDFDDFTLPNQFPAHWAGYDGGNGSTGTRIDQTTGLATSDHFLIITSNGSGGGYIGNDTFVQVRANQKVTISFDLFSEDAGIVLGNKYLGIRLADNFGNFYNATNGWQPTGSFYVIDYKRADFENQLRVNFEIAQQPNDYQLFFGVQAVSEAGGDQFETKINNVSIQPQTVSGQTAPPLGVFNRETLNATQSYKKDPILLLHGDEANSQRTSRISIGSATVITPPTFWERDGIVEPVSGLPERQSLLHIVANSELRNHQRPYSIFEAEFVGLGYIDINTLLVVDLLSPTGWIFLSGKFDIKTGNHSLRFAEVLINEPDYVEEFAVEDYGSEKSKQGFSVGQPDSVNTPPGGAYIDTSVFARTEDIPVKASAIETETGVNDDKFITPFKLLGWWTNIKTLAATISGLWNFTQTVNVGSNSSGADLNVVHGNAGGVKVKYFGNNDNIFIDASGIQSFGGATQTTPSFLKFNPSGGNAGIGSLTDNGGGAKWQVTGRASVSVAPSNAIDVVRLQELQAFKGSDNVLAKSAAYTVVVSDFGSNGNATIYVDTTSGSIAITLPTAAIMNGYTANIIKVTNDINSVVVTATINGITNDVLSNQFDAGTYKSNGTMIYKF